jgi:hypothetical protein
MPSYSGSEISHFIQEEQKMEHINIHEIFWLPQDMIIRE